ncbi:MAG: substrate-binding domain-containing protein [Desulfuromonadaceae bacterium]|nr:substrate-binding domain-containing protein [Desulfuromonadaceae bacterium]
MKKLLFCLVLLIPGAASGADIYWYVAAGMLRPGTEIAQLYNSAQDKHNVILITGGSGQLISKIRASNQADLYLPASSKFLHQAEKYALVQNSQPLLRMWPVFAISPKSKKNIETMEDLSADGVLLAMGNSETMALGEIYQQIEPKLPLDLAKGLHRNTRIDSINIQQTVSYLHQGTVDAGLLFDSVAATHGLRYVEIPAAWNVATQAYLVELKCSKEPEATAEFVAFIRAHKDIFRTHGFDVGP